MPRTMPGSKTALGLRVWSVLGWGCATAIAMGLPIYGSRAEDLAQPPICSASTAASGGLGDICNVTALPGGRHKVKVTLTAQMGKTFVGGYNVETEHYNDSYLSPVIEAMPGDTVAARLGNRLGPRLPPAGHVGHGPADDNPTNLHYFHGGIVTPRNARPPDDARNGNGDNIFVYLKNGVGPDGAASSFEYEVPIPGKDELDARVLEADTDRSIEHPSGLNWYHSHLHGRSSDQVMGGLSGLLSVGDAKANVVAACRRDPANSKQCFNDVAQDTADLKARTDVRYALLRDIALKNITALPEAAADKTADWAPEDKDWKKELGTCQVWLTEGGQPEPHPSFRKGYCQRDPRRAWLFTVNGQRFPTITVADGRNLLLRLGNLSPNVAYWLELYNEKDETDKLPLTLLSIDGVVPAKPVDDAGTQPAAAFPVANFLLMPASRAEIYVRNDRAQADQKLYILRTKGLIAGRDNDLSDHWPEIQLARIVLEPTRITSAVEVALNAVVAKTRLSAAATAPRVAPPQLPNGCIPDIDPAKGEHRRVSFFDFGLTSDGRDTAWSILTEIVQPPAGASPANPAFERNFTADSSKTVGIVDPTDGTVRPIPFEEYDLGGGAIDWSKAHACIHIDSTDPLHKGSHKQLWVLVNNTSALHNFHIHQMKFRLATADELKTGHKINLDGETAHTCPDAPAPCNDPDYKLYDDGSADRGTKWHDTIPMPPGKRVYLIMSFDASQQIGRFVFHCHILKHEDNGLMAPIEVWTQTVGPTPQ
jgi:FtsP/CotA-like multicopper oxidase with cupredoxin domain